MPRTLSSGVAWTAAMAAAGAVSGKEGIKLRFREPLSQEIAVRLVLHQVQCLVEVVARHLHVDRIVDGVLRHRLELAPVREANGDADGVAADVRRVRLGESARLGAAGPVLLPGGQERLFGLACR